MRHVVVMVTTSYPRFPGDSVGTFMEPIAKGVAARGHEVHIVAPWHPRITRGKVEDGVFFHFFRYAPIEALNVFGYAAGLRADVKLKGAAWMAAPLALAAGWFKAMRVAQKRRATVMHGHWVVPGGVIAAAARPALPLVISLHGSDVFVAENTPAAGAAARRVFARSGFVTACSDDPTYPGEQGNISEVVARYGPWNEHDFFVSGSGPMVKATLKTLAELQVPSIRIKYDSFSEMP